MEKIRMAPDIIPATRLEVYDVVNPEGEDMGQVQNFMVDLNTGRIPFVVVVFGGTLGLTDKWFAIPWELLGWRTRDRKFILDLPREKLKKAPGIDKSKWPEEIDLAWLENVYVYFGCSPYWC
jgi:sporulation protein YlmC with PRC-barrel domain